MVVHACLCDPAHRLGVERDPPEARSSLAKHGAAWRSSFTMAAVALITVDTTPSRSPLPGCTTLGNLVSSSRTTGRSARASAC